MRSQSLTAVVAKGKGKVFSYVTGANPWPGWEHCRCTLLAPSQDPALHLLCIPRGSRGGLCGGHKGHLAAGRAAPTEQRGGDLKQSKFPVVSPCLQHHCAHPRPCSTSVSQGV